MRCFRAVFASVLAAGALVLSGLVPVSPAAAEPYVSFDVTKLTASDIVFGTNGCKKTEVRLSYRASNADSWDVYTEVRHNGRWTDSANFYESGNHKRDRVQVCDMDGFGKYVLGPSEVTAYNYDTYWDVDRTDYTKGSFYVRAQAKTQLTASRKGSSVRLTAKAQRYNPDSWPSYYTAYNPKAKIQVKSGKSWKTVKTVQLKRGSASATVKSKAKRTYRVTFGQISWATGATSKSIKR